MSVAAPFNLLQPYRGRNDVQAHYTPIAKSPKRQTMHGMRRSTATAKTRQSVLSRILLRLLFVSLYLAMPTARADSAVGIVTPDITFVKPDLERQIAGVAATTTLLVREKGDKEILRSAFARLAELKARRHPDDIRRIERLTDMGE